MSTQNMVDGAGASTLVQDKDRLNPPSPNRFAGQVKRLSTLVKAAKENQTLLEPVVVDPAFSEERQAHLIDLHLEAGNFRSVIELFLDPSTSDEIKSLVKERIVEFFRSGRSKRVATTEIHLVGSHLAGEDISTAGQDLTLSGFSPESELPKTQVLRCVALVTESNGRAHLIENISEGDGTRHFHLSLPHRPDSEVFVWLDFMD